MGVKKRPWTMDRDERSRQVEKLIPSLYWFARKLSRSTIRRLGGFDEAVQKFALEAFQAVEDANRRGISPLACLIRRLKWKLSDLTVNDQVVTRRRIGKFTSSETRAKACATTTPISEAGKFGAFRCKHAGPVEIAECNDRIDKVRREVAGLKGKIGHIVRRRVVEGVPHKDVAKELGVSVFTVQELQAAGLDLLRRRLECAV